MMAVFLEAPVENLKEFFVRISKLQYPKNKINLLITNTNKYNDEEMKAFINKFTREYKQVKLRDHLTGLTIRQGRLKAMKDCERQKCEYLFSIDGVAQIDNPNTLRVLIAHKKSIIAPMLINLN